MKLLDQVKLKLQFKHYSPKTIDSYVMWIKRFIFFHTKKHPKDMGKAEIEAFLSRLAQHKKVADSTQNQALKGTDPNGTSIIPKQIVIPAKAGISLRNGCFYF